MCTEALEKQFFVAILKETRIDPAHLRILSDSSAARAVLIKRSLERVKHLDNRYLWMQGGNRNDDFQIAAIDTASN